jgi:GH24 family phage-related lysozyme (muramidase)
MNHDTVEARLRVDEGYETIVYEDTRGNLTGGIGHKCTVKDNLVLGDVISPAQIEAWFAADYAAAVSAACAYPWFGRLGDARQQIIVCLEFNMGPRVFGEFHETQREIENGDFDAAANALLDSAWASEVDPRGNGPDSRGGIYANILRTGVWQ